MPSTPICCFLLLVTFFSSFPAISSAEFDAENFLDAKENRRASRINQTVHKCCPKEPRAHRIYGQRPLFCCQDGLFPTAMADENEGRPPLWECDQNGEMDEINIVETVRCAQLEYNGRKAADICKVQCCQLFQNLNPPIETHCSRRCSSLIKTVDMTKQRLLRALQKCSRLGEIHFQAFKHCIHFNEDKLEDSMAMDGNNIQRGPCSDSAELLFQDP